MLHFVTDVFLGDKLQLGGVELLKAGIKREGTPFPQGILGSCMSARHISDTINLTQEPLHQMLSRNSSFH